MKNLFKNPIVRLAARAIVVGVGVFAEQIQQSSSVDNSVLRAALIAGGLAALEVFTPLNSLVKFKNLLNLLTSNSKPAAKQ